MPGYDQIDRSGPVPPYKQVAAILAAEIENGDRAPGSKLPPVPYLMHEYGIALETARKALREVAKAGLAELSPGMGYYVTESGRGGMTGAHHIQCHPD